MATAPKPPESADAQPQPAQSPQPARPANPDDVHPDNSTAPVLYRVKRGPVWIWVDAHNKRYDPATKTPRDMPQGPPVPDGPQTLQPEPGDQ